MGKFYAVKVGLKTGIFETWDECQKLVTGFKGAKYKSFKTKEEAEAYLNEGDIFTKTEIPSLDSASDNISDNKSDEIKNSRKPVTREDLIKALKEEYPFPKAYVDGSYFDGTYAFGVIFMENENSDLVIISGKSDDELAQFHNVAGEVVASMTAISYAKDLGLSEINICYDYEGIGGWASTWKTNNDLTIKYKKYCDEMRKSIKLNFIKVDAHSKVQANEVVDGLAKAEVGLEHKLVKYRQIVKELSAEKIIYSYKEI